MASVEQLAQLQDKFGVLTVVIAVMCFLFIALVLAAIFILKGTFKHNQSMINTLLKKHEEPVHTCHESRREGADIASLYMRSMKVLDRESQLAHSTCKVDRVAIYMFHNGATTLSGFPYLKKTCISEWVSLSQVKRRAFKERDMAIFNSYPLLSDWQELEDKGYSIITINEELKKNNPSLYYSMISNKIKRMVSVPIRDEDGNLIGYVDAEWVTDTAGMVSDETIIESLKDLAAKVGVVLQFTNFKELKEHLDDAENIGG